MILSEHFSLNPEVLTDETTGGTPFLALELPSVETRLRFVLCPTNAIVVSRRTWSRSITAAVQTRIEVFDEKSQAWNAEFYDLALPFLMLAVIEAASGIETSSFMDKTSRRNKANEISQELINQNDQFLMILMVVNGGVLVGRFMDTLFGKSFMLILFHLYRMKRIVY